MAKDKKEPSGLSAWAKKVVDDLQKKFNPTDRKVKKAVDKAEKGS